MNLTNKNCHVTFEEESGGMRKHISGADLTDSNNLPSFYTNNVRGIKKAISEIEKSFNDNTTMYGLIDICDKYNLKPHSYCAMD